MNFKIKNSKQLKNNIIDISAVNISDIIHNIFFDPDYTIYTTKQNKYFGTINKTSLINNFIDQFKSINQNYPVIDQNLIEKFQEIHQLATENQVKRGDSFGATKTRTESITSAGADSTKYDLIGKIVAGTTPSLAVLIKLANYFGVTFDYLIARNKLN